MRKTLTALLRAHKNHPEFGGMDDGAKLRLKRKLWDAIGLDPEESNEAVAKGYFTWSLSQFISKPVLAGAFSMFLVAGGWLTSVRAEESLPGQTLYSVKLMTEQAQLRLASLDKKAVLHTEFAGRRLKEISDLQITSVDKGKTDPLVRETIAAYKQEVASAAENLQSLKDSGDVTTLATASSVQQNLQAINTVFDTVVMTDDSSPEATQDVLDAKAVTKEVEEAAKTVVVEVHEQDQSELSANELKQIFKQDLGEIQTRQLFDLERIKVIKVALSDSVLDYSEVNVPTDANFKEFEYSINKVQSDISEAMNLFGIGGYRRAFEILKQTDQALLDVEAKLAEVEITIMTVRSQHDAALEEHVSVEDVPTEPVTEESSL